LPKKGVSNNPAGKPVGIKNQKTLEWESFGRELIEGGIPRVQGIMKDADDKQFMDYYGMLLEYFKPKLSRAEHTGKDGQDLTLTVTRTVITKKV